MGGGATTRWWVGMMAGVAVIVGCGPSPAPGVPRPSRAAPNQIAVEVESKVAEDATVYAVTAGARERLGDVMGWANGRFTLAWTSADLQFEVRFLGVGSVTTMPIPVDPGDALLLVITPAMYARARLAGG